MEDNQKYQQILETAHQLFWKFGIRRVSIEEICRESGVSKMTLYRFFPNKVELAKKVITNMFDDSRAKYQALMAQDIPFEEKIKQQVIMKFEGTKEMSAELVKDIYSGWNPELQAFFGEMAVKMTMMVRNDYVNAIENGWIRKDVKIDFIFYMTQKMTEMSTDPALLHMYGNNIQSVIMEFMNMMFYGILPRHNE
ncbi:MAG: TetR/AcrR family transcriptional regulator [Prolixibacteraceae bacterium]|nr:TetR/AcrR family transcriptional regulator [Prolixibacteraceae bacterium]